MQLQALWRYPVKSLRGERLPSVAVDNRGLAGDRAWAIVDAQGKLASGKTTQRFVRLDHLLSLSAHLIDDQLVVTFADGQSFTGVSAALNEQLSDYFKQPVTVEHEQADAYKDDAPIHIITTSALQKLTAMAPQLGIDARRFRANMLVTSQVSDDELLGKTLQMGDLIIKITAKTQRCRMVTLAQSELPQAPSLLKLLAQTNNLDFGLYAEVITPGKVDQGMAVALI